MLRPVFFRPLLPKDVTRLTTDGVSENPGIDNSLLPAILQFE